MRDKIIKILVNRKWKRERFLAWSWGIDENVDVHIITEESYQDRHRFGVRNWEQLESEEVQETRAEPDDIPCSTCEYLQTKVDTLPCCECKYIRVSQYKRRAEQ